MSRLLAQSIDVPRLEVDWQRNVHSEHIKGSGKSPRSVKVMCHPLKAYGLRMLGFSSGPRGVNPLDTNNTMLRPQKDFYYFKVPIATSRRGRASTCVTKAMYELFNEKAIQAIMLAQEEARRLGHNFVGTEQILLGIIGEGTGIAAQVLKSMGINLKNARVAVEKIIGRGSGFVAVEIPFTPRAKRVLELSHDQVRTLGHDYLGTEHLLLGILREGEGVAARVLENMGVEATNIRTKVFHMVNGSNKTPTLEEYGTNLTKLAEKGKLDPAVGRLQIDRVIQILARLTKNNPCLIGEPGTGKTAIVEGLAHRIANGFVPETIKRKTVISLDMSLLVARTKYREKLEDILKKLMDEIKESGDIILFIDEMHTLIGDGAAEGATDAANMLKSAIARGELQCMGATTLDEYRKHIEKDPTLEKQMQPVAVPEPSVNETIQILKGLRERYEIHHKVRYTDEALVAAAQLSQQYISDRFLPDKAIDLIDDAGSWVQLRCAKLLEEARKVDREILQVMKDKLIALRNQDLEKMKELRFWEMDHWIQALKDENEAEDGGRVVTEVDVQHIISSWTGIPVERISMDEYECLLKMEETLHNRDIGDESENV